MVPSMSKTALSSTYPLTISGPWFLLRRRRLTGRRLRARGGIPVGISKLLIARTGYLLLAGAFNEKLPRALRRIVVTSRV
jgi:hypothetical protein